MQRRTLFRLAAQSATAAALPRWAWSNPLRGRDLFALGVASGSPSTDGFVLWTRLLGGPVPGLVSDGAAAGAAASDSSGANGDAGGEPLPERLTVRWEVADDEGFKRIATAGQADALAALGHSVHVEVAGMQPDRWYFYRFMHGDAVSAIGRTRTLPAADTMPARLRFAFASCQRWEHGYYAAHRHLLDERLDLLLFLGDYIYEYATPAKPSVPLARRHSLRTAATLADFRDRYALHKSDADLQAVHRACPWIVTWDDHEVQNNYAGTFGQGPADSFAARRAAAYQAFYENMPLRASVLAQGVSGLGTQHALRIYDRYRFGRLAGFHVLDTRQYRDRQACRVPGGALRGLLTPEDCPEQFDPQRTMLGTEQERWLQEGLRQDAHGGAVRWSVLAQQTLFSQRNYRALPEQRYGTDAWDGYPAARQRMLDALRKQAPRNAVFIGGDIHQNYVCRVKADFTQPDAPVIASEFCGTSISSATGSTQASVDAIAAHNPHVLLARADRRGYSVVEVTPARWTTTLRVLDDVTRVDSGIATLATFDVEDGRAGPVRRD
ncbi:MAG: alkaline phosphatase D family protein [Burkholderiales bacterium]|nr:alkaline phosphatase D family protein [Burkholderiales bacterium]